MTRTVFMGTPEFAVAVLDALVAASFEIVGVYTRSDRPAGRGQRLDRSPVKQRGGARSARVSARFVSVPG